ncbi:hypothetical protein KAM354_32160 [Aeromonas caviae]|nr:hypothetical protein KAM354_32160 [Aeromonas caviae]
MPTQPPCAPAYRPVWPMKATGWKYSSLPLSKQSGMPGSPDADTAPVRACVQARLAHEGYKVEVQLTAAI